MLGGVGEKARREEGIETQSEHLEASKSLEIAGEDNARRRLLAKGLGRGVECAAVHTVFFSRAWERRQREVGARRKTVSLS